MPRISNSQLPPPLNWEEFEDVCYELWKANWKDPNTQKNGRKGQPQSGVDIYGKPSTLDGYVGVQCKGKDNYLKSNLTINEIDNEIKKATSFKPPLMKFIIATTEFRDIKLQEYIRLTNEKNINNASFEISISFWEDIKAELENHIDIAKKYWSQFFLNEETTGLNSQEKIVISIQKDARVNNISAQQGVTIIQNVYSSADSIKSIVTDKYNSDVDFARDLILKYKPSEAIEHLENLKTKFWNDASAVLKFRILTNIASSRLMLGQKEIAARLFIEALQYNADDEKALTNTALGYMLLKDYEKSKLYSGIALTKNPASGRAFSIYLQSISPNKTISEIEEEITLSFKDDSEVLNAVGFICRNKEDLAKAEYYFEKAYSNMKEEQIEIVNSYATILLQNVIQNNPIAFGQALTDDKAIKIRRSIELFNQVWDAYQDLGLRKSQIGILVNRSLLKRIIKDNWGAISDIDEVIKTNGEKPEYLKFKALLLIDVQDTKNAIKLLETIHLNDKVPESDLILSELLEEANEFPRAIKILEECREKLQSGELKQDIDSNLVALYIKSKEFSKARKLGEALCQINPKSVNSLIVISKILRAEGKINDSKDKLLEAIVFCVNPKDKFLLSEELYENEFFEQAAKIYGSFVNTNENHRLVRHMVASLFNSGKLGEALQICIGLREKYRPLRFITGIEIEIYDRIGDLKKAITVSLEYLTVYPDDIKMKVHVAFIYLRQRDFSYVDEFLKSISLKDYNSLTFEYFQKIALLYSERGMSLESINVLYEARRNFFNSPDAHMLFASTFFMRENEIDKYLNSDTVSVNFAVYLQDHSRNKKYYIIEERDEVNFANNEININHSLAKLILGKKVGESIILEGSGETYTIIEIKSKFVYALHESLSLYPMLFPERRDLISLNLEPKGNVKSEKLNFEPIFKHIDSINEHVKQGEHLYLKGNLTIGGLSNYLQRNIFEVLSALVNKKELGIRCCLGIVDERLKAMEYLAKYDTLVIDVTGLLVIKEFNLEKKLFKVFKKNLVTQTTLDLLNETISRKRGLAKRGYKTISKEGDKYIGTDIDASFTQKSIEFYESLIIWIKNNFTIEPCNEALNMPIKLKENLDRVFQSHFIDAVLLAKEKNALLYSDDYLLRNFAESKYQTQGFWTQLLLMYLLNKKNITDEDYENYLIKLISSNYKHTSISSKTLITSLQKASWLPDSPFLEVADILDGNHSDLNSTISVAIGFIKELKESPITPERRQNVIFTVLHKLTSYRNPRIVLENLQFELNNVFLLLPLYHDELLQDIEAWKKANFS